jgi:hypothetical protein
MKFNWGITLCLASLPASIFSQELPVQRVVLYKSGVGYFEHLGSVRDNQNVTVPFTSGQLNDVLKSLTVLDLNGGRITGVEYGSAAPIDRQLGDLRLPLGEKASLTEFFGALRGARLEIRSGTTVINGRLLSAERKTRIAGGTTLEVDYLSLIDDKGELRTTELSPQFSVRLLDRGLAGKVDRFLDLVSAGREVDVRRMVISTEGAGQRSLYVSYISEVPVWKTTYRVVLSAKSQPLLQGWAIVDNTVGQDWEKVQLSLVAGAPQSFIQNLSQPYFTRRPVVPLPESMLASPQTYEAALVAGGARITGTVKDQSGGIVPNASVKAYDANGGLLSAVETNAQGVYDFGWLPEGAIYLDVNSPGFQTSRITGLVARAGRSMQRDVELRVGATTETVTVNAQPANLDTESASMPGVRSARSLGNGSGLGRSDRKTSGTPGFSGGSGSFVGSGVAFARASSESAARAQELGDLFEYKLKEPITIRKNRSALVPIVQSSITAEKVSIWNEQSGLPRPQLALWLTNSSGLTLDGGSFSVMEDETFAGEGIVEPIRPGEKRLVSYATDLALTASSRNSTEREHVTRVRISKGMMTQDSEIRERKTYTFRNEDKSGRAVIIEHPVRAAYQLKSEDRPIESTPAWHRFRLHVDPKQTASLAVDEARVEPTTYALTNLDSDQVALFIRQQSINKPIEDAFQKILEQKGIIANLESQKAAHDSEMEQIFDDQQRLRENMKALRGSAEEKALLQRYTQQLNEQETRLERLRKETKQLESQLASAHTVLDHLIQDLSFDVKV